MKKVILMALAACLSFSSVLAKAQENARPERPTPEQMMQHRAQSVAAELSLDDKTSAEFVKIYVDYLTAKRALRGEYRKEMPSGNVPHRNSKEMAAKKGAPAKQQKPAPVVTDEAAAKSVEKSMERRQNNITLDQKLLDLDKQYNEKFEKVLNPKQMKKLYEINNKRPSHPQGGRPGNYPGPRPNGPRPQGYGR